MSGSTLKPGGAEGPSPRGTDLAGFSLLQAENTSTKLSGILVKALCVGGD